jgi:hypothetical protein
MACGDGLHSESFASSLPFPLMRGWRIALLSAGIAVAVVLFVVLSRDEQGQEPQPPPPTSTKPQTTTTVETQPRPRPPLTVRINSRASGLTRISVPRGRHVLLLVTGDPGAEIHLHGYDVLRRIPANRPARISFRATIPGRFEVELEAEGRQIADLSVLP